MDDGYESERIRDVMIQTQPILWAQAMLKAAEECRTDDARDAILARIGLTLFNRFGVLFNEDGMRKADDRWTIT